MMNDPILEAMWAILSPESVKPTPQVPAHLRSQVRSDSVPQDLMTRMIYQNPGYMDAFFKRADDVKQSVEDGPATGANLNELIMNFMRMTHQQRDERARKGL
jgi:hypothetical protein